MRCLIDTNILISAALFPSSVPAKAFVKAVSPPYTALVSDYTFEEMRSVYKRKFPHKIDALEQFILLISQAIKVISTPLEPTVKSMKGEASIRDINDRPIYRAAIEANADAIITGDKDLLDSSLLHPKMLTAAEFMNL